MLHGGHGKTTRNATPQVGDQQTSDNFENSVQHEKCHDAP